MPILLVSSLRSPREEIEHHILDNGGIYATLTRRATVPPLCVMRRLPPAIAGPLDGLCNGPVGGEWPILAL
jgi:hypothetical protein